MSRTLYIVPLTLAMVFTSAASSSANDKSEIINSWKLYFERLQSLKVDTKLSVEQDSMDANLQGLALNAKFVSKGLRYRADMILPPDSRDRSLAVTAFNGELYQNFIVSTEGSYLKVSDDVLINGTNPYSLSNPVVFLFTFVFGKDDIQDMETLQKPRTWEFLSRRVTKSTPVVTNGRKSTLLSINQFLNKPKEDRFEVLVDDETNFPISVKTFSKRTEGEVVSSLSVIKTAKSESGLLFPVTLGGTMTVGNKLTQIAKIKVNESTLSINKPVPDEIFTVPKTQATSYKVETRSEPKKPKASESKKVKPRP